MGETSGLVALGVLLILGGFALYLLPAIVAFSRNHEYRWVIFVLTIFGGWTGVGWLIAMVWAAFPHNRPVIDPILGPATGVGYRNAGDVLGAVQFGQERGYHEEQKKRVDPWWCVEALAICIGLAGAAAAALVVIAQVAVWLRKGVWEGLSIGDVLPDLGVTRPKVSWIGVQRIIDSISETPLSLTLLLAGILVATIISRIGNRWQESRRRERERKEILERSRQQQIADEEEYLLKQHQ